MLKRLNFTLQAKESKRQDLIFAILKRWLRNVKIRRAETKDMKSTTIERRIGRRQKGNGRGGWINSESLLECGDDRMKRQGERKTSG